MSSLNAGSVWSASLPGYCIRRDGPRAALQPLSTAVGEMWAVSSKYSKNVSRDGADRPDLGPGLQRQDLFQDPFLFCRGHICVSTPGQGVLMQGRGTSDLKHTLTASATFFGSSRIRCTTDLAAPSSLQVGSPVKRLHTTPPPLSLRSSVQPAATHAPTHTNFLSGHDSTKTCQIAAPGCCCSLLMTRGKQTLASRAACSVVWQPAKPGGSKVWSSRFPRGRSSRDFSFLCALCMRRD